MKDSKIPAYTYICSDGFVSMITKQVKIGKDTYHTVRALLISDRRLTDQDKRIHVDGLPFDTLHNGRKIHVYKSMYCSGVPSCFNENPMQIVYTDNNGLTLSGAQFSNATIGMFQIFDGDLLTVEETIKNVNLPVILDARKSE